MRLYDIYKECGGVVSTDSRSIKGGELFFALKGENFDGNLYALKALEAGARYAVVNADAALHDDPRLVKVEDSFKSLQELAIWHREHVLGEEHLPVLGLTGTNGKTTTKELIREVLSVKYKVTATEGNLNNDIGVPLSILKIRPDTEIAVIEMGANHPDDIAKLVQVSRPDYGLITNVGKAHLLGFGSFEGVKAAKGELYRYLAARRGAVIFQNADDEDLRSMSEGMPCHFWQYGLRYQGVRILETEPSKPFVRLEMDGMTVESNLVGSYNAVNMLAAIAVGEYFGVSREAAAAAIAAYKPANNRSQMTVSEHNSIIVDAYNANPSSMAAAIDNFRAFSASRKLALLGDMRELGADSVREHRLILDRLCGLDAILVGEEFRKAIDEGDYAVRGWFPDSEALAAWLEANPISDTLVLLKGSRGIQMEKALPFL